MLRSISIEGFRALDSVRLNELAPLTLLAGPNNVGKSSVIHFLLALLQSEEQQSGIDLMLSGAWCDLGSFTQVLGVSQRGQERAFAIGLNADGDDRSHDEILVRFSAPFDSEASYASIKEWSYRIGSHWGKIARSIENSEWYWNGGATLEDEEEKQRCAPLFRHPLGCDLFTRQTAREPLPPIFFSGLSSERTFHIGPHRIPPRLLYEPRTHTHGPPLGRYAEFTADFLYRNRFRKADLPPPPGMEPLDGESMLHRINQWWSYIFEGRLALHVNAPLRAGFTMSVDTPQAEQLDLGQVGFGLSQALPIVVAAVGSRPGDLLLIETPEAHLHPGAQHRLGMMFAELARAGRQVILETHSEHMVNALRLAVKRGMPKEQTAIWFFRDDEGRTIAEPIPVDDHGRILKSLPGFFDQAVLELSELLR